MRRDCRNWACSVCRRDHREGISYKCLKVGTKRVVPSDSMRSKGHKHKKFHPNVSKNNLSVTECWNRLLREVIGSPCLAVLKTHLGMLLCHLH